MKKLFTLMMLLLAVLTTQAGETFTFNLGVKNGESTPSTFFSHDTSGKWSWNSKFSGGKYDGISFDTGLKMEGSTKILFTTTETSTVTIVQSTWSAATINLDATELAVADAAAGTGCRIYTVENVEAGDHTITRGSGESGLFYVKVEYPDKAKTVTFINDAEWSQVYVWAWNDEENFTGGTWPGVELTANSDGNYTWSTMGEPTQIIFSNGEGGQTADLVFVDGGIYNSKGRIIDLKDFSVSFKTDGMTEVWAYVWKDSYKALGDWPGTQMTEADGVFTIDFQAENAPAYIIFHNNNGEQTPDWAFEEDKTYEYNLNTYTATFTTDAGWENVYAYAKLGSKELVGEFPGVLLTATDGVFSFSCKAFNAPDKILFNDGTEDNKTINLNFIDGKAYKYITAKPLYVLTEGDSFDAGQTVEVKDGGKVVATITYGFDRGAEFSAAAETAHEDYTGFTAMCPGNGENGTSSSGTVYIIKPLYYGTITVGVRLNAGKAFYVEENGTNLPDFNGIKIPINSNTSFSFPVKAGSTYKVYCTGSKLGFFGFDYKYSTTAPITFPADKKMISYSVDEGIQLDLSKVEGLTAYIATDVTAESVKLAETKGMYGANGYILEGTAGATYEIPVVDEAPEHGKNCLHGTNANPATVEAKSVYVLSDGKFKTFTGTVIPANKAYLTIGEVGFDPGDFGGARELTLVFGDEATGIDSVTRDALTNGKIYNLQGQEVRQAKGIVIMNGKKVIMK